MRSKPHFAVRPAIAAVLESYAKSLELDPGNANAGEKLNPLIKEK